MTGEHQLKTETFFVDESKPWILPAEHLSLTGAVVLSDNGELSSWLFFGGYCRNWRMLHDASMLSLVDGERMQVLGEVSFTDTPIDRDTMMCLEVAQIPVSLEWFAMVSTSQLAKIRVAGIDFELDDSIKAQFGELVAEANTL